MDRDTIIDGLRMTMDLCVFDPSTGEEIDPDMLNDINRATYDACKGALEILERLDTDSDTISRQAALDALKSRQDNGKGDISRFYNTIIQHDIEAIEQLPPIQPVNNSENPKSLDVVSRQAAKNAICNACGKIDCDEMDTCKKLDIPSARSKALEWQYHSYIPHNKYCPKCKKDSPYNKRWNFCPNCGVDMRGERDG